MSGEFMIKNYYLISMALILLSFLIIGFHYEKKRPPAGDIVTLAVLSAIAIASRAVFAMIPFFKPMMGVVMICGMVFGPGAGFMIGALSGFGSNFIFGQGPWTPWQMFAYGLGGALAAVLAKLGIMKEKRKKTTAVAGYLLVQLVVGPLLDTSSFFILGAAASYQSAAAVYTAGVIPNAVHGLATCLTLYLAAEPMMEKLNRMKIKYGVMNGGRDEV